MPIVGAKKSLFTIGGCLDRASNLEKNLALPCEIKYAYLSPSDYTPPSLLTEP